MNHTSCYSRSVIAMLICLVVFGLGSVTAWAESHVPPMGSSAQLPATGNLSNALGDASDADIWRRVRAGDSFTLSYPGLGASFLVQSEGEWWRTFHSSVVTRYGGMFLLAAIVAVAAFFLLRGRVKIDGGRSGDIIPRFTMAERSIHWFVAALFLLLALSGSILLFGKFVLLPVFGPSAFAVMASAALEGHNLFGPLFIFGIIAMLAVYMKDNFLRAADIQWIFKGGFLFSGHAPSWKYNFGEKMWFWIAAITGVLLSASGILMLFPGLAEAPSQLQLANIIHGMSAVIVIAAAIGHLYLGTIGVEGALEGMIEGDVDVNWAREHHDHWAAEVIGDAGEDGPQKGDGG